MRVIHLLGYREIALKSNTVPAIIVFRKRVAEGCNAQIATEDGVTDEKRPGRCQEAACKFRIIRSEAAWWQFERLELWTFDGLHAKRTHRVRFAAQVCVCFF